MENKKTIQEICIQIEKEIDAKNEVVQIIEFYQKILKTAQKANNLADEYIYEQLDVWRVLSTMDMLNGFMEKYNEPRANAVFYGLMGYFIKNEINSLPPQPINLNESKNRKVITESFNGMDRQGWKYAFVSQEDYNLFVDLLTNFFEFEIYTLPEKTIQLKRTCKTKIAKALGEIHRELSNENKLINDDEYFKIVRVLSHFTEETKGDLYKALTR